MRSARKHASSGGGSRQVQKSAAWKFHIRSSGITETTALEAGVSTLACSCTKSSA
jgi:hypothetical protein